MGRRIQTIIIFILITALAAVISLGTIIEKKNNAKLLSEYSSFKDNTIKSIDKAQVVKTQDDNFYTKLRNKKEVNILVMGDDTASSSGVNESESWTNILKDKLEKTYSSKVNIKVNSTKGENILGILMDVDSEKNTNYDLVVIDTGENDLNDLKYNEFSGIYESLIRKIKQNNNKCEVLALVQGSIIKNITYPKAILDTDSYYNVLSFDARDAFKKSSVKLTANGILPNADGYKVYAEGCFQVIKAAADNNKTLKYDNKEALVKNSEEYGKVSKITKAETLDGFTQKDMSFSASKSGSSITINSTGTLVWGNIKFGPDCGKLNIIVDDKFIKELDLYSAVEVNKPIIILSDVVKGNNKIKLQIGKSKNRKSSDYNVGINYIYVN